MSRPVSIYMHTIDGKPAMYQPNGQIVFIGKYHKVSAHRVFVDSLSRIKREQQLSKAYRERHGLYYNLDDGYGYIRLQGALDKTA